MEVAMSERVAFLRGVRIFAKTPEIALAQVAAMLQVVMVSAGVPVVTKGEPGDSMYLIHTGKVRVHDGDLVMNYLGPGEVFGEISLLDFEVRSMTVTAETDTTLYRLDQQALYDLLASQPEVARGLIQVLTHYLRGMAHDRAEDFQYMQQFAQVIRAAQMVEMGRYQPEMLAEVAQRPDELGQLARVFQQMASEVLAREWQLRQQVQALQIKIDWAERDREVQLITETESFHTIRQRARLLKQRRDASSNVEEEASLLCG
jgi:CRP-like cAMP-binding protein